MNAAHGAEDVQPETAIEFTGTWREYLPIALTNLLLTVVTLGIYRFWAKARERRYLWSRTRFIDEHLEWTGTGKEMFVGFLIVFLILLPVFYLANTFIQGLVLRGETREAGLLFFVLYGLVFYLIGVARFRALRYRLSRTWWHGIRGGSADGGWALGLLIPWAMTSLWNDRWNRMSFGQHQFEAAADTEGLFARWLLVYLVPVVGFFILIAAAGSVGSMITEGAQPGPGFLVAMVLGVIGFYAAFLLVSLSYYAAYYREVALATSIAGIRFEFDARTRDWLKLILGNIALIIITLGVGALFLGYRNWAFAVRHMEAGGEIHLDTLTQSTSRAPGDAEGLADAFDIGAF
ncbi:MAG: DUF898 domain-containing protein [Alphaproteobacteria bacterium]|nr:MAG: DUF898 domain-containing protein [Alphaproteobacteria bacterium]